MPFVLSGQLMIFQMVHPTHTWPLISRDELINYNFRNILISRVSLVGINLWNEHVGDTLVHWRLSFAYANQYGRYYSTSVLAEIEKFAPTHRDRTTTVRYVFVLLPQMLTLISLSKSRIKARNWLVSNAEGSLREALHFDFVKAVTIDTVLTMMEDAGHHRFENSPDRSGCYFWCYTVLNALRYRRMIEADDLNNQLTQFVQDRRRQGYSVPFDFTGQFYARGPNDPQP
jgi:hypothetical protein